MAEKSLCLKENNKPFRVANLMIGDWVNTPIGELRVRSICQDGTIFCGDTTTPSEWKKFIESEIKPIYLDVDILNNNDFEFKDEIICVYKDLGSKKSIILERDFFPDGTEFWHWNVLPWNVKDEEINAGNRGVHITAIMYVHELQHIMHLASGKPRCFTDY